VSAKANNYERVEVTFSKTDETEVELYEYLLNKSKIIGRTNYIKQLIYEDMLKDKELKK
jgi:hypothetical protein